MLILLCEDDPRDAELTLAALSDYGVANCITTVRDGADALDFLFRRGRWAERDARDPVLVLLDLKMPKVDGVQVLETMKNDPNLRTVPVVMLTSSSEAPDVRRCYELGANPYVVKPVEFEGFSKAVRDLGLFWLVVNEPPASPRSPS
ncbi:MAG: response regulator [Gammaproteobacteria bacterium]|nr:response regulator [Gammaproteobacteria bacterium]